MVPSFVQRALAEASARGAEVHVSGAEITVEMPDRAALPEPLRRVLTTAALRDHLGVAATETSAVAFLRDELRVAPRLISDPAEVPAVKAELTGTRHLGIDIETAAPGHRPPAVRINKDGSRAARQDEPDGAALDPNRAQIQSIQLYGGGDRVFVLIGAAKDAMLADPWLCQQPLVAHNAFFETVFLLAAGVRPRAPIDCTMHAYGLIYGPPRRLKNAVKRVLNREVPKEFGTSDWAALRFSLGQICYAGSDAVLAYALADDLLPRIARSPFAKAYTLARDAIPGVAAMVLRGLGFDRVEYARHVDG